MLGQTHIQGVNLIENVVDKKYKKYDAFLWKFSHGGLFLASGYSAKIRRIPTEISRYLGFVIIL